MTISLRKILGEQVASVPALGLDWQDVSRYLARRYIRNQAEQARRSKANLRHSYYRSAGDGRMIEELDRKYDDPDAKQKRSAWVPLAKFGNVWRRIATEVSTVYAMPASRTVSGDADNERYQEIQRLSRQHEVMSRINRWAFVHRNLVIGPRVRPGADGVTLTPTLDVVTPDCFHAVAHPLDPTRLVALILDLQIDKVIEDAKAPAKILWSAHEHALMDASGNILESTVTEHGYGRIPWMLFSLDPPAGALLDTTTGDDIDAAHLAVWFEYVNLLKESKSANNLIILQGDMTRTARQQSADSEGAVELPEGTTAQALQTGVDLRKYLDTAQRVFETVAANYGLPPAILNHQGVQSAEARELMRVPLRELRLQQQIPFRDLERELVALQALVIGREIPELAFSTEGWSIDFADPQTPLGTREALDVFGKELELGLTSRTAELMRRNPDLTREQAKELERLFAEDKTEAIRLLREFQALAGGMPDSMTDDAVTGNAAQRGAANDNAPDDLSWVEELIRGAA